MVHLFPDLGRVVYVLKDKRSDEIRYVGVTYWLVAPWAKCHDPQEDDIASRLHRLRLQQHFHASKGRKTERARWLLDNREHIEIEPIGIARDSDKPNGLDLEKYWVGVFDAAGHRLLNCAKDMAGARQARATRAA